MHDLDLKNRRNTHIERRRRGSLLIVAFNRHPFQIGASEQKALQLDGIAVVVEMNRPILGEEGIERFVGESMWMATSLAQDHQIRHIHNANAEFGCDVAQQGSGGNCLERHGHADTTEDAVEH